MRVTVQGLAQLLLFLLFVLFSVEAVMLINVVFTIVPFTFYGKPVEITVNVGFVMFMLALICLALLLWRLKK